MADGDAKLADISRNDGDCGYADKENEPLLSSDNEKKREDRDEGKGDGDDIKLNIGEQYMVRRAEDTWRKSGCLAWLAAAPQGLFRYHSYLPLLSAL